MGGSKTKNYWSKTNKKVAVPKKSSRVIVLSYTYVVKKKKVIRTYLNMILNLEVIWQKRGQK